IGTADHDDGVALARLIDAPGPGRAAAGVPGRTPGDQGHAAERDLVAVLEDAIHRAGFPPAPGIEVLALASRGDHGVVAAHHVDLGPGQLARERVAGYVVGVGMASEQDLDIAHLEAERFDVRLDERYG